jgi:hypothetical protein
MTKIAGSGSGCASGLESGYGFITQRHGSADPVPDPHQNVMDPQHCFNVFFLCIYSFTPVLESVPST